MKTIGITTTVPIEVLMAAGYKVVDLNNLFITSDSYDKYIDYAEREGFPKSSCAWIKGIYGACLANGISEIVGVVEGDCSNTRALMEVLKGKAVTMRTFAYPHSHKKEDIRAAVDDFMETFGVSQDQVELIRKQLAGIRQYAKIIDELTYKDNKATGFENHICQVTLSDLNGDSSKCSEMLENKITEIKARAPKTEILRLGFIGVPPMICDIYDYVETLNARFVYNEVQREFAFPRSDQAETIYEQYYDYTYPYDLDFRLGDIKKQIRERRLDGIIHYTQAFCHRAIEDIVVKRELDIPVLTIEGDKLNRLDPRTKLRLEAFLDMLVDLKEVER